MVQLTERIGIHHEDHFSPDCRHIMYGPGIGSITDRSLRPAGGPGPRSGLRKKAGVAIGCCLLFVCMAPVASASAAPPSTPLTSPATDISAYSAVLHAETNPNGTATEARFEFVDAASYEASGFSSAQSTAESFVGSDSSIHQVSAEIGCAVPSQQLIGDGECLAPDTAYRWRVVVENADGESGAEGLPFTTRPQLEIIELSAGEIDIDSARLSAEVDPLGLSTVGHFEYVDQAAFETSGFASATRAPAGASLDFGAGEGPAVRSASVSSLAPDTSYRYRLVASSPPSSAPVISAVSTFATATPPAPSPPPPPPTAFSSLPLPPAGNLSLGAPATKVYAAPCTRAARRARALSRRARRARSAARRARTPGTRRKMRRVSVRSSKRAGRIARNTRYCRQFRLTDANPA